jgi:hypothetical protein
MCSRFAGLFWVAFDRADHAVMVLRCRVVDLIYGPEPATPADEKREADRERLREAFPGVDFDGTTVIADKEQDAQTQERLAAPIRASGAALPRSAASAHRRAP